MASNYNINDMVKYLNQYNQQQSTPQYQITPEQVQAYKDMFALRQQQAQDREVLAQQMQQAAQKDAKMGMAANMLGAIASGVGNRGGGTNSIDLVFRDYRGNVIGQLQGDKPQATRTPVAPQNVNTNAVKQQLALQEQQQTQQLANVQEMAKFQEAVAVANHLGIPIGQAMGLTGKDILGYNKDITTAQAGVQKEIISSLGNLYEQNLTNEGNLQLQELKNTGDYNTTQLKAINDLLIAKTKAENDYAIAQLKEQGLNDRQINDLISRKEIANINAKAQTDAAATRAAATRYAADQRVQGQPSFGPVSAGMTNYMFYPEDVQRQIINDYNAYARKSGLREGQAPQVNPQNVNTMNNYINNQDASSRW